MKKLMAVVALCFVVATSVRVAGATSILYSDSSASVYRYGEFRWENFSKALNTATDNHVTTTGVLSNYEQMMQYDAVFVNQRWTFGSLSAAEIDNITKFISTGRKVLLIGENDSWTDWNRQILGIVGGTYNHGYDGVAHSIAENRLTAGVESVLVAACGMATGGTALFDKNFATLWGPNVLTVLDVNIFDNSYGSLAFDRNVAEWLADSNTVPEPSTLLLAVAGLGAAFVFRKRLGN